MAIKAIILVIWLQSRRILSDRQRLIAVKTKQISSARQKMSGKNRVFKEKWKEWKMIRELVPFFFILRNFVIKATLLSFGLWSVLWISGVIYGSFYYGLIPLQTYHLPLNFNFEPCPMSEDKDRCSFLKVITCIPFYLTKKLHIFLL